MTTSGWDGTIITVLRLHPYHAGDFPTGEDWRWERGVSAVLEGAPRATLLQLWDDLPPGEQARCHMPVYGFGAARNGVEVFRTAICFECNNASIWTPEGYSWREFDADTRPAKALLSLIQSTLSVAR